jgi:hypothetical protein
MIHTIYGRLKSKSLSKNIGNIKEKKEMFFKELSRPHLFPAPEYALRKNIIKKFGHAGLNDYAVIKEEIASLTAIIKELNEYNIKHPGKVDDYLSTYSNAYYKRLMKLGKYVL